MILPSFDEILLYNSAYGCMMKREIFSTERRNFRTFTLYHFVSNEKQGKFRTNYLMILYAVPRYHILHTYKSTYFSNQERKNV